MANKTNSSKNFFENILETQQKVVDTMVENTKKMSNGNQIINDAIDKGNELYKKTVESTKNSIDQISSKTNTVKEETTQNFEKSNEYFTNWYNQQLAWAKQMTEMNSQFMQNISKGENPFQNMMNAASAQNPMQYFTNMWSQNPMQQFMNTNNYQEQFEKATEQFKSFYNQFQSILNNNYLEFTKGFQNGTLQDSFKGMFNMTDGFSKFYEMWMPMFKSIQDKTFNMDTFNKNFDMSKYKEFMDNLFSFMPQSTQDYSNQMKNFFQDSFKTQAGQAKEYFSTMKNSMETLMPTMFGNPFTHMLNQYNAFHNQLNTTFAPYAKLITPNNDTKTLNEWAEIMHELNIYNIKNAELQHMIYTNGVKVMENIAEKVANKIENGESIDSLIKLYQEWLNTSDKNFVALFESDAYSKLMAEVHSLQLRIKKATEKQIEKLFKDVPVATRSEMDELYQTIYDLKKQVRQLQSMLEIDEEPVKTAKKSSKK
ncbi:MAG TPA: poly(R)-hydroxyalkanoic acid synthase subunit PhaE [Chitinophagaceae bacterium]|nr:poly(R)-hydroxyalkanoic acid synthase subunit PhaE [Chitinophagaceae bacterium]